QRASALVGHVLVEAGVHDQGALGAAHHPQEVVHGGGRIVRVAPDEEVRPPRGAPGVLEREDLVLGRAHRAAASFMRSDTLAAFSTFMAASARSRALRSPMTGAARLVNLESSSSSLIAFWIEPFV